MKYEENIPLTKEDLKKIKQVLKNKKFEEFDIHKHFYRDKFTGSLGKIPRHNVNLAEVKKIYEQQNLIKRGSKRQGLNGMKYALCYEESTNVFIRICYFLDENPPKIFQAIKVFRNLEKAVPKRYGIRI